MFGVPPPPIDKMLSPRIWTNLKNDPENVKNRGIPRIRGSLTCLIWCSIQYEMTFSRGETPVGKMMGPGGGQMEPQISALSSSLILMGWTCQRLSRGPCMWPDRSHCAPASFIWTLMGREHEPPGYRPGGRPYSLTTSQVGTGRSIPVW